MDYRVPSAAGFADALRLGAVEVRFGDDAVEAAVFDILVDRMLFPQRGKQLLKHIAIEPAAHPMKHFRVLNCCKKKSSLSIKIQYVDSFLSGTN